MGVLSWGKCTLSYTESKDGAPGTTWKSFEVPKLDSTTLSTSAGDETLAQEEGGGIVDAKYTRNTYEFTFDLFVKKGGHAAVHGRRWDGGGGVGTAGGAGGPRVLRAADRPVRDSEGVELLDGGWYYVPLRGEVPQAGERADGEGAGD